MVNIQVQVQHLFEAAQQVKHSQHLQVIGTTREPCEKARKLGMCSLARQQLGSRLLPTQQSAPTTDTQSPPKDKPN